VKLPRKPPSTAELLRSAFADLPRLQRILEIGPVVNGRYAHWEKLRFLPRPGSLSLEDWWVGLKMARMKLLRPLPLLGKDGQPFRFGTPDHILRMLHEIDQSASGRIEVAEEITNPTTRDRYVVRSLIEESITSSQLEGASTTTEAAKNMIRSGRRPAGKSEQMIWNNYQAMQFVRAHQQARLTPDVVFGLHRVVTEDTLRDSDKAGAFRTDDDEVQVERRGVVLHVPPPSAELPERMDLLCRFANDRPDGVFVHPVVRAIVLHFWIAYDHPFVDGNGRTARALFYWSLLSQGYWLAEYLSISRILKEAPARYARSFLLTETDENDMTYFIEYQLDVVCRAMAALQKYLQLKMAEVREIEDLLRKSVDLNHRQLALLTHALRHPGHRYTIESHKMSHNVVYQTARADLLQLAERGILRQERRGRSYLFTAPANLAKTLQELRST
jgi:Fic family protein